MRIRRSAFFAGIGTAVGAAILMWLLTSQSSPFHEYLAYHTAIPNYWMMLNFPAALAGALVAGDAHDINENVAYAAFLIQWFLIGFILTSIGSTAYRRFVVSR